MDAATFGIAIVVAGVLTFAFADRAAQAIRKRQAEGGDRFSEEQRSYRAYPSLSDPRSYRLKGMALVVLGLVGIVADFAARG